MKEKGDFNRILGSRIKAAREATNVRQDQLARAVGLSRTSITNIERGRQGIQVYLLARIAEVLGQPVSGFLLDEISQTSDQLPDKVKHLDPSKREWAERILTSSVKDKDHEA